jgi:hypothetical protein
MDYVNRYEGRTLWSTGQDMQFKWGSTTVTLRARPAGESSFSVIIHPELPLIPCLSWLATSHGFFLGQLSCLVASAPEIANHANCAVPIDTSRQPLLILGFGLMVPDVIHKILTCAGIKDCSGTIEGSRNPMQVLKATLQLLHPGVSGLH